ncbi:MAG: hypothetical protein R2735_07360 [Microthrixaceae bacterium]
MFGDEALPGKRSFRPSHDWDLVADGPNVPVKVLIEFVAFDEENDTEVVFELERSTTERLVGDVDFEVAPSNLVLLRRDRGGVKTVENATATIASLLPPSLKDIFFIDGDRASCSSRRLTSNG